MDTETAPHVPPQGSAPVYRRLGRAYGPLAVAALLLILMALLIPTRSTEKMPDDDGGAERSYAPTAPILEVTA